MTTYTDAQLLEQVTTAIYTIVTKGKSVSINGRRYERHDIGELYRLKEKLQDRIDSAGGTNFIKVDPI